MNTLIELAAVGAIGIAVWPFRLAAAAPSSAHAEHVARYR